LIVQTKTTQTLNPTICAGQSYSLPWGAVVTSTGVYRDTLRYTVTNCDSVYRIVNLTVQTATTQTTNPKVCSGQTYTLPWGATVAAAGTYRDTLRYAVTNCDSIYRIVNLTIQTATTQTSNPKICAGQSYTLPWGVSVTAAGTYRDTLRYTVTNCDSVYRIVNLTVQSVQTLPLTKAVICQGSSYTLPWGAVVNTSGIYSDTLRYASTGCDSVRRAVDLTVLAAATVNINATICQGQAYQLPSGKWVSGNGIFRDTLRYQAYPCDSLYTIVNLSVTPARAVAVTGTICNGDTYMLPWGTIVTTAGVYKDTLRTAAGCDSLIRTVTLTVNARPTIRLSKSNDINCVIASSKLNVLGGVQYLWSPAASLSDATVYNPVATPTATTVYSVKVTAANGCEAADSIRVNVSTTETPNAFPVPNAFSPNNDGLNDCFGVQYWGAVSNFTLEIFNRWGERVFSTTNSNECWNGTYKGIQQDPGLFSYKITAQTICGKIVREGTMYLIR
jgi:gliding motility-associated-like protein